MLLFANNRHKFESRELIITKQSCPCFYSINVEEKSIISTTNLPAIASYKRRLVHLTDINCGLNYALTRIRFVSANTDDMRIEFECLRVPDNMSLIEKETQSDFQIEVIYLDRYDINCLGGFLNRIDFVETDENYSSSDDSKKLKIVYKCYVFSNLNFNDTGKLTVKIHETNYKLAQLVTMDLYDSNKFLSYMRLGRYDCLFEGSWWRCYIAFHYYVSNFNEGTFSPP